jgi:hypothetical protein
MASLFAYLSYRDAAAATRLLEALGFRVVTRQPGDDGSVLHTELRLGDAVIMLANADYAVPPLAGRSTGSSGAALVCRQPEKRRGAAMPERNGYIPGVPCWVDTGQPDPEAVLDFYSGLFGWEFENVMPPGQAASTSLPGCAAAKSPPWDRSPRHCRRLRRGAPTFGSRAPTIRRRRSALRAVAS